MTWTDQAFNRTHALSPWIVSAALLLAGFGTPRAARADGLSLESCVARALSAYPGIRAADREIEAAKARLRQAGALDAPTLSYQVGKLGTPVSTEEREAAVRVSQDLAAPGQRGRSTRVARAELALAEASRESFVLGLRGEVTRAYRRLQADILNVRALDGLRNTATDLEEMVGSRLRTGSARYLDVLRARAERARIENDVIEAERSLREHRRALNSFMVRGSDEPLEPTDSLAYAPLTDSLASVLGRAHATRPRLRSARLEVERSGSQIGLARTGLLPTASISAGLDRVPGSDRPGFGGEISLSLPFLPWTDQRARVTEARALQAGAEARLEVAEREIETALRNAYEAAHAAERQVQQFDRFLLADAADAIRTAVRNYQAGQIDGLELFETLRTFRSVRLEYIRSLVNYELALTDLAVAE